MGGWVGGALGDTAFCLRLGASKGKLHSRHNHHHSEWGAARCWWVTRSTKNAITVFFGWGFLFSFSIYLTFFELFLLFYLYVDLEIGNGEVSFMAGRGRGELREGRLHFTRRLS